MKYKNALLNESAINMTKGHEKILKSVQANILRHHKRKWSKHIFIKFFDEATLNQKATQGERTLYKESSISKARAFLATFALTSANQQLTEENTNAPITCMCLSFKGYKFLNLTNLMPSNTSFEEGLSDKIKEGFNVDETVNEISDAHAMILIAADHDPTDPDKDNKILLDHEVDNLKSKLEGTNCEIIFEQDGEMIPSNISSKKVFKDQFGFVDGISNVRFFPKPDKSKSSMLASSIAPLKTVLVADFDENSFGSYLVFLKLEQDKTAFEYLYNEIASKITPEGQEVELEQKNEAKALIMGRYVNGAPIMKKSKKKDYTFDNDFDYHQLVPDGHSWKNDANGMGCPYFSHIRKANSRNSKDGYSYNSKIVRRGVNYKDAKIGNRIPRGLLFMSYQRNIQDQFESLVTEMLHNSYEDGVYTGSDILTGKTNQVRIHRGNPKNMSINPADVVGDRNLVTLKGGAYFFAPSLSFFDKCLDFYPPLEFEEPIDNVDLQKNTPSVQLKNIPQGIVNGIKNIDLKPMHFGDFRDDILKKILNVDELEAEKKA